MCEVSTSCVHCQAELGEGGDEYCVDCIEELDEEDVYCPNCGIKIKFETE